MHNILIETEKYSNVIQLIKMCLNEFHSKAHLD
jgi:hypothetical protein